jgi:hypothetical protein
MTVAGPAIVAQSAPDPSVLESFRARVGDYVALHRRLEGPLPPLEVTSDPQKICDACDSLARKLQETRAKARQGDIVTSDVAALFASRIREVLMGRDVAAMLRDAAEGDPAVRTMKSRVNASFPHGAPPSAIPPAVLSVLPSLPPELEYRLLHRDLLLWDTHARMIVDFIPRAFPAN